MAIATELENTTSILSSSAPKSLFEALPAELKDRIVQELIPKDTPYNPTGSSLRGHALARTNRELFAVNKYHFRRRIDTLYFSCPLELASFVSKSCIYARGYCGPTRSRIRKIIIDMDLRLVFWHLAKTGPFEVFQLIKNLHRFPKLRSLELRTTHSDPEENLFWDAPWLFSLCAAFKWPEQIWNIALRMPALEGRVEVFGTGVPWVPTFSEYYECCVREEELQYLEEANLHIDIHMALRIWKRAEEDTAGSSLSNTRQLYRHRVAELESGELRRRDRVEFVYRSECQLSLARGIVDKSIQRVWGEWLSGPYQREALISWN